MNFIQRIDFLIKKNGITRNALSKEIDGLNHNSFYAWENRGTIPSGDIFSKIADYFGVSTDWLITGKETSPNEKKLPQDEINLDELEFALFGEVRELSDEDKQELLKNARRMRELIELRKKQNS